MKLPIKGLRQIKKGNIRKTDWLYRPDGRWFRKVSGLGVFCGTIQDYLSNGWKVYRKTAAH